MAVRTSTSIRRTTSKTSEEVTLVVNYNTYREAFTFPKDTKVKDAISKVVAKYKLSDPLGKLLLHCGRVMKEDTTLGNYEGVTVVQLINKAEVPLRAATEENLKDHDKYFGFCGTCKLLVNIRPVVSHCHDRDGKFAFSSDAELDFFSESLDLTGKCLDCKMDCKASVFFDCMSCGTRNVAFLRLIRKNTPKVPCMNCCETTDRIFVFPCTSRHCMCLNCFIHYCQAMMNSELFRNFVDVGYSVSCPARDLKCKESPVLDPHHFCLVDNKGPFYTGYKDKSAFHPDLPDTSILCICKHEIDMSLGREEAAPQGTATARQDVQQDIAGIGWFRTLKRWFSAPVITPPPARSQRRVSCSGCQTVYCCGCKMQWHQGECIPVTEEIKEREKFDIKPENALRARWPPSK